MSGLDHIAALAKGPPESLLSAVSTELTRAYGIDDDLAFSLCIGAASAALCGGLSLKDNDGTITASNLYLLAAAPSGTGKSRGFCDVTSPIYEAERNLIEKHRREEVPMLRASKLKLERDKKIALNSNKLTDGERLDALTRVEAQLEEIANRLPDPRLIAGDVTVQKLALLLAENGERLALMSPDARDVILNLKGRFNEGSPDEGIFLSAFSREPLTVDRIGRESVLLKKPTLAILLLMTPDSLTELFSIPRFQQGGFLSRCLVVSSESMPKIREAMDTGPDVKLLTDWRERLRDLLTLRSNPVQIKPMIDASDAFREYWNDYARAAGEGFANAAFDSRNAELAKRLALVLHALEHGPDAGCKKLGLDTTTQAIRFIEGTFKVHREMLLAQSRATEADALIGRLRDICHKYPNRSVKKSELSSRHKIRGNELESAIEAALSSPDFEVVETSGLGRRGIEICLK